MDWQINLRTFMSEEELSALSKTLEDEPKKGIRVNLHKTTPERLQAKFPTLKKHPLLDYGFLYQKEELALGKHPYHLQGLYYIQEPSAMMVGALLHVQPNDKVIDLCAAPGGKSSHIASFLGPDGFLLSNDVSYKRALELSKNMERTGNSNILVTSSPVNEFLDNFTGYFDKVVLDAPCSGEGMFRKNDLALEDWSVEKVERLSTLQKELILQAYQLLKKDGVMIYSTCTFEKKENEEVIEHLLANTHASLIPIFEHPTFTRGIQMKEAIRLYPFLFPGEGHFLCLIRCNDEHPVKPISSKKERIKSQILQVYQEWEKETLHHPLQGTMKLIKDHLYLTANDSVDLTHLSVLRDGLDLGEIKNDRFVPSFALALALEKKDVLQTMNVEDGSKEAMQYLKGEALETNYQKGYVLVLIDECPIGWGKASHGRLNNHLPKGLRR